MKLTTIIKEGETEIPEDKETVVKLGGDFKAHISGFNQLICFTKSNIVTGTNELTFQEFVKIAIAMGFQPTNSERQRILGIIDERIEQHVYLSSASAKYITDELTNLKELIG